MMDVEASYSDFINCDRTGRRNAVPDITSEGEQVPASTSELAKDLAQMELQAAGETPPGPPTHRSASPFQQLRLKTEERRFVSRVPRRPGWF